MDRLNKSKRLLFFIKLLISLILIFFLLYNVNWKTLYSQILLTNIFILLSVIFLRLAQFAISSSKWLFCLKLNGITYRYFYLLRVACISFFMNNFFPSSIGGDGYRIYKTTPKKELFISSLSAILMERIAGISVLISLGFLGSSVFIYNNKSDIVETYFALSGVVIIVSGLALALFKKFVSLKSIHKIPFIQKYISVFQQKSDLIVINSLTVKIFAATLIFHLIAFLSIQLLFLSFGQYISIFESSIVVSLSVLISLLPISINGIGISETAFVFASVQIGADYDIAVMAAFVNRGLTILISLLCGIIYAYENFQKQNHSY